ncbi:TPA: hypothetical protein ACQUJI_000722 [Neisseria cinerea]|jgi:hypothetical integral membrane protein
MTDRPNLLWIKPGQAEIMEYCEPEEESDQYATYRRTSLMAELPLFVVILVLLNIVFPLPAYPLAWLVLTGFMVLVGGFPLSLLLVALLVLTCCILACCPPLSRLLCYPCPNHPISKNSA